MKIQPYKIKTPGLKGYKELLYFYGIRAKDAYGAYLNKNKKTAANLTLIDSIYVHFFAIQSGMKKAGLSFDMDIDTFIDAIDEGTIKDEDLDKAFKVFNPPGNTDEEKK